MSKTLHNVRGNEHTESKSHRIWSELFTVSSDFLYFLTESCTNMEFSECLRKKIHRIVQRVPISINERDCVRNFPFER